VDGEEAAAQEPQGAPGLRLVRAAADGQEGLEAVPRRDGAEVPGVLQGGGARGALTKEEVPETDAEQAGRHMQTLRAGRSRCCLPGLMSSVSESSIPSGTCSGDDDAAASWRNTAADAAPGRGGAETWVVRRRRASAEEGWFFWGDLVGEKKSSAAAAARSPRRQQRRTTRKPERRGRAGRQAGRCVGRRNSSASQADDGHRRAQRFPAYVARLRGRRARRVCYIE